MSEISEEATNLIDNFEYAVEDAVSDYMMAGGASYKNQARYNLEDYIAELEAEVEELKPYRDGYDPEEDFPPEGENVIATHNNWLFLAQRRNGKWYDSLGAQAEIRGGVDRWWKLPEVQE